MASEKDRKQAAQDALMHGMQCALSALPHETDDDMEVRKVGINQFKRVEKLFGYEPNSWQPFV